MSGGIGDLFGIGSNDEQVAKDYGLTPGLVAQNRYSTLGNIGGILLAASAGGGPPGSRAQYLAKLGGVGSQSEENLGQMATTRLRGMQMQAAQQEMSLKAAEAARKQASIDMLTKILGGGQSFGSAEPQAATPAAAASVPSIGGAPVVGPDPTKFTGSATAAVPGGPAPAAPGATSAPPPNQFVKLAAESPAKAASAGVVEAARGNINPLLQLGINQDMAKLLMVQAQSDPQGVFKEIYERAKTMQDRDRWVTTNDDGINVETQNIKTGEVKVQSRNEPAIVKDVSREGATSLFESQRKVEGLKTGVNTVNNLQKLVDEGIFTGTAAPIKLEGAKAIKLFGDTFGLKGGDLANAITNTEVFKAEGGKLVIGLAKQLGSGAGITDADREFAGKVAANEITLDETSIRKVLNLYRQNAAYEAQEYNKKVSGLRSNLSPQQRTISPYLSDVTLPAFVEPAAPKPPPAAPGAPVAPGALPTISTPEQAQAAFAEAEAAIARGADPVKVRARLQQLMGAQ